ncbi:DUF5659 domain-containing protein [Paenibacillus sp. FSL E2-0274]|uniref:DUF5659 domain-containing protein n=1 Tax=Paenibacillus TaxID=44249 RepID=UPI00096BD6AB|nr:DUF5659 domain-containing protein [Paenibacillus odorifer]OME31785.1 hypothetical protein BSK63_14635 [Paenibacillus odorifer]OME37895.1 hypothetical protein BSK46_14300 [Paenibacillus odorifer]
MNKYFVVTSQRVAGHLMGIGFVIKGMGRNRKFPERSVFFFNNTERLQRAIAEFNESRATVGTKTNE